MAATSVELDIVRQGKACIEKETVNDFAEFVSDVYTEHFSPEPAWPYIVQKLYLHRHMRSICRCWIERYL
jgi:hypothetical protein